MRYYIIYYTNVEYYISCFVDARSCRIYTKLDFPECILGPTFFCYFREKRVGQKNVYSPNFCKALIIVNIVTLTLFRMGFLGAAHRWGGGGFRPASLKSATHILQ